MSIQTLFHRYRCLRGHHQPDEFPPGVARCRHCETPLPSVEDDWAADLFWDEFWDDDFL